MRRFAVRSIALAFTAAGLVAADARAQGFGVYEHDACAMGRAGTGVANPCDNATALFFNPAGIVNPSAPTRWQLSVGGTIIAPRFTYRDSVRGTDLEGKANNIPVPNFYITRQLNARWAVGLGVFAPYGLVSEWPEDFEGRFLGYRSDLKTIYIQPTAAFRINDRLSIGAGLDYIRSIVDLRQRVDLASQNASAGVTFASLGIPTGTDFADAHIHGKSWSATAHLGALFKLNNRFSIGARYLMRSLADLQGDAEFEQVGTGIILPAGNPLGAPAGTPLDTVLAAQFRGNGPLREQHASARINLPDQAVLGVAWRVLENLQVLGDIQWVHWTKFRQVPLAFEFAGTRTLIEDYEDTFGYRFGAEYTMSPSLTLRAGGLYHQAAAPAQTVTPLLPEAERSEMTLGGSFKLKSNMRIDIAYQHIWQASRRGRVVEPTVRGPAGAAVNTGLYGGSANLFGASLAWWF